MITALIRNGLFLFVPGLPVLQYSRLFQYQDVPDVDTKELVELIEAVGAEKGLSLDPSVDGAGGIQIQLLLDVGWRKRRALMSAPIRSPVFSLLMMTTLMARFSLLCGLRQPGLERLVFVDFDTTDELGDPQRLTLACECMGRNANLVLCDGSGRVIDAVRRTDATDTTRIIMPGAGYTPPPAKEDFCLLTDDPRRAVAALAATPLPGRVS